MTSDLHDHGLLELLVDATPDDVLAVVADVERYPSWARGVTGADVLAVEAEGRPARAWFRVESFGWTVTYTLAYDWSDAPDEVRWRLVEGDAVRDVTGSLGFTPLDGGERCRVVYELDIVLKVPVPAFVKRRAESRILSNLEGLKDHVEKASR